MGPRRLKKAKTRFKMSFPAARQTASEVALSQTAAWGGACQFLSGLLRTDACQQVRRKGGGRLKLSAGTRRRRATTPCSSGCFPGDVHFCNEHLGGEVDHRQAFLETRTRTPISQAGSVKHRHCLTMRLVRPRNKHAPFRQKRWLSHM